MEQTGAAAERAAGASAALQLQLRSGRWPKSEMACPVRAAVTPRRSILLRPVGRAAGGAGVAAVAVCLLLVHCELGAAEVELSTLGLRIFPLKAYFKIQICF